MKYTYLLLLTLSIVAFSCGDPCDDVDCGPNGTCIEGDCDCDPGYSGLNCETNVCDSVNCNNGTCDPATGDCMCDEGYEGSACDTEIREKYLGDYNGDISACIEQIIEALQIIDPDQIPDELLAATASVVRDPDNINNVLITSSSLVLGEESISLNPADGTYTLPTMSQTIETEDLPFPITITTTGDVTFLNENSFELNFSIIVPLLPTISCTIILTKE